MTKMKVTKYKTEEEWLEGRRGKISGTKAGNLVLKNGKGKKMGYYEILAERVAIPPTEENRMDRGKRLEDYAIERFVTETGKKVDNDLMIWTHDKIPEMIVSPDGWIPEEDAAAEVKCLSSALHCKAYLTQEIPDDYEEQVAQYFVINEKLKCLYFIFFNPEMPKDFFFIKVTRADIAEKIEFQMNLEQVTVKELAEDEKKLTF